jgi:hypothetical protein
MERFLTAEGVNIYGKREDRKTEGKMKERLIVERRMIDKVARKGLQKTRGKVSRRRMNGG